MHLSHLDLRNFRSFTNERIYFEKSLTVLLGENNGGKSNIVDALRLITSPLETRRELYCEQTDIRFGSDSRRFDIQATFEDLSPPQQGRFLAATTDDSLRAATIGLTYDATDHQGNVRPQVWAGRFEAAPEQGSIEMIRHVYLPPLRDARRALSSGNPTRIYSLLNHFIGSRDPDEVARSLARTSADQILADVDSAVATGLEELTAGVRRQESTLGFNEEEQLIDVARDLRFKLADHGIAPEDLRYSGHGFANLLYIATIAVQLARTDDAELTLFLVEEPEAHLHPQLQAAVLSFLEERARHSLVQKRDNAPAGHVQVVVATHSPNLSAWVPSKSLVLVRSLASEAVRPDPTNDDPVGSSAAAPHPPPTQQPTRRESRCIPLAKLDLEDTERRKLDRYLDVTKSALLFGGRVMLVEGIAEALLFPPIAKHHVLRDRPDDLRTFRSAVFVPIDGVDFVPYAKALLCPFEGVRITDRLVIVTDGDVQSSDDGTQPPGELRRAHLEALAAQNEATDFLFVVVSTYSLEAELVAAGNSDCMRELYITHHPRSAEKWSQAVSGTGATFAKSVQDLFKDTPKGDFAQALAEVVRAPDFQVPSYIRDSIEALVR